MLGGGILVRTGSHDNCVGRKVPDISRVELLSCLIDQTGMSRSAPDWTAAALCYRIAECQCGCIRRVSPQLDPANLDRKLSLVFTSSAAFCRCCFNAVGYTSEIHWKVVVFKQLTVR